MPALLVLLLLAPASPPPAASGPYTEAQADSGQHAYRNECARCHGLTLQGGYEEPPLEGARFVTKWRERTTGDLVNFIGTRMPPERPGGLGGEVNLAIAAHILRTNGVPSGPDPLTAAADVPLASILPPVPPAP